MSEVRAHYPSSPILKQLFYRFRSVTNDSYNTKTRRQIIRPTDTDFYTEAFLYKTTLYIYENLLYLVVL